MSRTNTTYQSPVILPELAPVDCPFAVFPHPFDVTLLHVFHQHPVNEQLESQLLHTTNNDPVQYAYVIPVMNSKCSGVARGWQSVALATPI